MVGGGGLIQVPALVALFPFAAPASIMGTSKFAGVFGTAAAFIRYARQIELPKRALAIASLTAGMGAITGAWLLTKISREQFDLLLPILLTGIFIYTLVRKDLGQTHVPRLHGRKLNVASAATGATLGLYDGFFGPGTGSFFVFLFVRLMGYDFLHASATAKLMNTATNGAALALFAWTGHVWWQIAAVMAVTNVIGSLIGTRLALAKGAGFVRGMFVVVVSALILKTGWAALQL